MDNQKEKTHPFLFAVGDVIVPQAYRGSDVGYLVVNIDTESFEVELVLLQNDPKLKYGHLVVGDRFIVDYTTIQVNNPIVVRRGTKAERVLYG